MQISSQLTDEAVLREIGARLGGARVARGLSCEAVAAQAGIPAATVALAEAGHSTSFGELLRLLRVLDAIDALDALLSPAAEPSSDPITPEHPHSAPDLRPGFVVRDNRGRQRTAGRRGRGSIDRRASGGPKPPGRFIWGDEPPPAGGAQ